MDAIAEIIKNFQNKRSRSLIVLATGTGKTRTACGLSDIFIRNNFVKRILFLADRKNLVTQAKEETFDKYLSDVPMTTICLASYGFGKSFVGGRVICQDRKKMQKFSISN